MLPRVAVLAAIVVAFWPSDDAQVAVVNVALNKPTAQETTFDAGTFLATSDLAVDGNPDPVFLHQSCSHTYYDNSTNSTWWMVDLMGLYQIYSVKITNRNTHGFRLNGFYGYVSERNPAKEQDFPSQTVGDMCFYQEAPFADAATITLPCNQPLIGRYFTIYKLSQWALTMCELEVMAVDEVTPINVFYLMSTTRYLKAPIFTSYQAYHPGLCALSCPQNTSILTTAFQVQLASGLCECLTFSDLTNNTELMVHDTSSQLYVSGYN